MKYILFLGLQDNPVEKKKNVCHLLNQNTLLVKMTFKIEMELISMEHRNFSVDV